MKNLYSAEFQAACYRLVTIPISELSDAMIPVVRNHMREPYSIQELFDRLPEKDVQAYIDNNKVIQKELEDLEESI